MTNDIVETTRTTPTAISLNLPKPILKTRPCHPDIEQECFAAGLPPIIARVIAARPLPRTVPILQALSPRLQQLSKPESMRDMQKAAERVAQAILQGEIIGLETDHDCDGQTSHAVLYYNLVYRFMHPANKIRSYIGHRLTEGYGLSKAVAQRILTDSPKPTLVITADNGSADEPRIALLRAANIDVIVTDHHEIPKEGCPKSAYACLNPTQADCEYGDPYIAGCMVAWLLMAATRQVLIKEGYLSQDVPSLLDSLDYVAVGTVADCVSMARSLNNRIVVSYGLRLINEGNKPCWRALQTLFPGKLRSEDLGFKIGPLLNSDGRLSSAFGSVSLLLSETEAEAHAWIESLKNHNTQRKTIQRDLVKAAIVLASQRVEQGCVSLTLYLEHGHTGVQGIAASRIKDIFGRPTAIFAKKPGVLEVITGSVRGVEGFHVREALQFVANQAPQILLSFGGHQGAGGLTLHLEDFEIFQQLFETAVQQQFNQDQAKFELHPIIWTEGKLEADDLTIDLIQAITSLEPFGREFEAPVFEVKALLQELKPVGDGTHIRVRLQIDKRSFSGIWFSARQSSLETLEVQLGDSVTAAFSVKENNFRNDRKLDLQIIHLVRLHAF